LAGQVHVLGVSGLPVAVGPLDVLGDPGVEVGPAVSQAAADLDRRWSETSATGAPRVEGRLRDWRYAAAWSIVRIVLSSGVLVVVLIVCSFAVTRPDLPL
jgi:hypothetical protein